MTPRSIRLKSGGRELQVSWPDGSEHSLPAEFLRVHSPSAEVQGHGGGEGLLLGGKREVAVTGVVPVGRYAVRLSFSDGHDTGLYTWQVLARFGAEQDQLWTRYLQRLDEQGMSRDEQSNVMPLNALLKRK